MNRHDTVASKIPQEWHAAYLDRLDELGKTSAEYLRDLIRFDLEDWQDQRKQRLYTDKPLTR